MHSNRFTDMCWVPFSRRVAVALFVAVAIRAEADSAPLPFKYARRAWGVGQGLPQSTVECVVQDRAGFIWAGTQEGIVRFDGFRFKTFDQRNVKGLGGSWVRSIHVARDGSLWFTNGGLVRLKDGVFRSWPENAFPGTLREVDEGLDGALWLVSSGGLLRFREGRLRIYGTADGLIGGNVASVVVDAAGRVWVATSAGVFRSDGGKFQRVNLPGAEESASRLVRGRNGTILIATNSRIIRFDRGRFSIYPFGTFNGRGIRALHEDSKGTLRVGFALGDGIVRFDGKAFVRDSVSSSLTDQSVHAIFEDREGILWVGTAYGGLNQLRRTLFTTYDVSDGLVGKSSVGLFADRSGGVWIGTPGQGFTRYSDGHFQSYGTKSGLAHGFVHGFEQDSTGAMWIALLGAGVQRFERGRFSSFTTRNGLLSDFVSDLHFDRGTMWMATAKALTAFDGGRFRHYTERDGLTVSEITRIAGTSDRLWVGTAAGLQLLQKGRFARTPISGRVLALCETKNGTVWVGAVDQGLWRIRQGKFTRYSMADGLLSDSVNAIVDDGKGSLWLSSNKGVTRVLLRDLDELDRMRKRLRTETFSISDGMASSETNSAAPGMVQDGTGRIWVSTIAGVAVLDPTMLKQRLPQHASVVFDSLTTDGTPQPPGKGVVRPGTQHIVMQFAGIHFMAPEDIQFRYRLVGFDRDWVDAGDQRQAHYTRLSPGNYRLEVATRLKDEPWSPAAVSMPVVVKPFFRETMSFRVACVVLLVVLPFILFQLRIVRMKRRQQTLQRTVNAQAAFIADAFIQRGTEVSIAKVGVCDVTRRALRLPVAWGSRPTDGGKIRVSNQVGGEMTQLAF